MQYLRTPEHAGRDTQGSRSFTLPMISSTIDCVTTKTMIIAYPMESDDATTPAMAEKRARTVVFAHVQSAVNACPRPAPSLSARACTQLHLACPLRPGSYHVLHLHCPEVPCSASPRGPISSLHTLVRTLGSNLHITWQFTVPSTSSYGTISAHDGILYYLQNL